MICKKIDNKNRRLISEQFETCHRVCYGLGNVGWPFWFL